MNGMEGIRFTRNGQNTRSFGKFLVENPTAGLHGSSQVTSAMGIPFPDQGAFRFEIEIPCILLLLNRNKNSYNSPKRMHHP